MAESLSIRSVPRRIVLPPVRVALAPLAVLLAAARLAVERPSLVVSAAVLLVCLPGPAQEVFGSQDVTLPDVAAVVTVVAVAIRVLRGDVSANGRGWLPFAAVAASVAVATVTAIDVGESLRGFVRHVELFVLVPVAVAMAVRDRRDVLLIAGSVVMTTVVEGAIGVWQYVTMTGASYAGEYVRAVGTFGAEQVLALGAVVGYGLVVTLALALSLTGWARLALLVTTALLVVPLGMSLSRGAWIATALAALTMLVVYNWRAATAVIVITIFAGTVLALGSGTSGPAFGERVTSIVSSGSEPDRSVRDRYALWETAVDIWVDHPVVGVGLKDFAGYRDSYAPMSLSAGSDVDDLTFGFRREPLLSAHNQYLMILSEQGTMGILAFGGLLGALAFGALRRLPRRIPSPPEPTRFFDLVAPGVMTWTLIDFTYGDIGAGPTGVVLAILLGLVARRSLIGTGAAEHTPRGEIR